MDVCRTFILPISCVAGKRGHGWWFKQVGRLEATHSNCRCSTAGMKPTYCHRLETKHEQCGTSPLKLTFDGL
eukprot:364560-Chlamydomonas_euryale.AAC.5